MIFRNPVTGKEHLSIMDALNELCTNDRCGKKCPLYEVAPGGSAGCFDYALDHYKEVATMLGLEIIHENTTKPAADTNVGHTEEPDMVNQPPHYTMAGIECADALDAMVSVYPDVNAAALAWQVGKYVWRHPHKGRPVQDLEKARWYLNRLIEHYKKKEASDGK